MKFFSPLLKWLKLLESFLFPKSEKVLELEALTPGQLLEILPRATTPKDHETQALFDYSHPLVKELVWELKYKGNRVVAEKLGTILFDTIVADLEDRNLFEKLGTLLLIPTPISDKRRLERGWNQCELLCEAVKRLDTQGHFKYLKRNLAKIKHTESQTRTADKREREENIKNSMQVFGKETISGRSVVLIDDVTTTGSTFAEAKRALKDAGAKKVLCIALAH